MKIKENVVKCDECRIDKPINQVKTCLKCGDDYCFDCESEHVCTEEKLLKLAFSYGQDAYDNGSLRLPFLDKDLIEHCIEGLAVGEGATSYFREWLNGWDSNNLKSADK